MNLFKRAFFSTTRKPIKSLILGGILYCLSVFLVVSVAIYRQQEVVQNEIRNQVGAGFRLELCQEDALRREIEYGYMYGIEIETGGGTGFMFLPPRGFHTLFREDITLISQLDGISGVNVTAGELEIFPAGLESVTTGGSVIDENEMSVRGVLNLALLDEVAHEFIVLQEGRWIEDSDVDLAGNSLVISSDFADLNNISLGDDISLEWRDMEPNIILEAIGRERYETVGLSGEVVGIFTVERPIMGIQERYALENTLFANLDFTERAIPYRSIQELDDVSITMYDYTLATFQVSDVNRYEEIRTEILNLDINWERYNLVDSDATLQRLSGDFSGLEQIGMTLFSIATGAGFIILVLVFTFWMRSRTHEIAILLSVGVKQTKIILQFICEGLMVLLLIFGILVMSSPFIPHLINGNLLNNMLQEEDILMDGIVIEGGGSSLEASVNEYFSERAMSEFSISLEMLLYIGGIMALLIVVAVGLTTIPIMRMKPRDILSKMS